MNEMRGFRSASTHPLRTGKPIGIRGVVVSDLQRLMRNCNVKARCRPMSSYLYPGTRSALVEVQGRIARNSRGKGLSANVRRLPADRLCNIRKDEIENCHN
ncbi:hypothetical protein AVEN_171865-1 [Araneus ventricosus]|uniref:Uncharacterized protein n=1 Tax=Araneus ventricosus TaxID=182803 RepID=A0A4Y2VBD7_ARAVE|nr:hypothetical protein AVEN_171865-1 [Araneus ventricosus]